MRNFIQFGKKIVAVGRNYADHCQEMGKAIPTEPFFFLKPTTCYVREPNPILIPQNTLVEHEVEVGVVIGKNGRNIKEEYAMNFISGYVLAIDITARDLQKQAAEKGLPWCLAKGFDTFCPVSSINDPHDINFTLEVNGKLRQIGNTKNMIFKIPQLLAYISKSMTLQSGDVILTGTPKGVGPLKIGDRVMARMEHDYATIRNVVAPFPRVN